jgi:SMP-30/Gluconolactonase/LRE-like region
MSRCSAIRPATATAIRSTMKAGSSPASTAADAWFATNSMETVTVIGDRFQGKRLNSPNDIVVHPDGGVWFTDSPYGINGSYEGFKADKEVKEAVYRVDPKSGQMDIISDEMDGPNGICFSSDYKKVYVADTGSGRQIRVWDIDGKAVRNGKRFIQLDVPGSSCSNVTRVKVLRSKFIIHNARVSPRSIMARRPSGDKSTDRNQSGSLTYSRSEPSRRSQARRLCKVLPAPYTSTPLFEAERSVNRQRSENPTPSATGMTSSSSRPRLASNICPTRVVPCVHSRYPGCPS